MNATEASRGTVLIVDDEEGIRVALATLFRLENYTALTAGDGKAALAAVRNDEPDAVLLDIRLGGEDGIAVLEEIKAVLPETIVIMITGHGSIDSSVSAMKEGAADYILKPLDNATILETVRRNLELKALRTENSYLKSELRQSQDIRVIRTRNARVREIVSVADRVKNTSASVLITGESGSGKELLARYIHFTGNRRDGNFIGVNSAALSESLLLSELFGHEKGAFTGAVEQRPGKFEMAHGGTLFLDEIGDMSMDIQSKILRVLEERSFERVGGVRPIAVDVRVIAATNRDLETLIEEGRFREDLYYRLKVITCTMPPLRNRREDIPILVEDFIAFYNDRYNKSIRGVTPELMKRLRNHGWPGNIRELRNLINQAVLLSEGEVIDSPGGIILDGGGKPEDGEKGEETSVLRSAVDRYAGEYEAKLITEALGRNHGNKSRTAAELGISRKTLARKMERYRIG